MGSKLKATDYATLDKYLGGSYSRTIGHKTTAERRTDGSIMVSLFGNQIARLFSDDRVAFTLAGWPTVTTRNRLNQLLPLRWYVSQVDFSQYACDRLRDWKREPIDWNACYLVDQGSADLVDAGSRWLADVVVAS